MAAAKGPIKGVAGATIGMPTLKPVSAPATMGESRSAPLAAPLATDVAISPAVGSGGPPEGKRSSTVVSFSVAGEALSLPAFGAGAFG